MTQSMLSMNVRASLPGMWLGAAAAMLLATTAGLEGAPVEETIYVEIDYSAMMHHDATAYIYHMKNGVWTQFPDFAQNDKTSAVAFSELFYNDVNPGDRVWFRGVSEVRVLQGDIASGDFTDVTNEPAYTEMNHHFVMKAIAANRAAIDPCGRIQPVAVGSEMTTYTLPSGYAMEFAGADALVGGTWHWTNPGDIQPPAGDELRVYIAITIQGDDARRQSAFNDVHATWISADYCDYSFCLPSGEQMINGPQRPIPVAGRVVLAMPHLHDHATEMQLIRRRNNGLFEEVYTVYPENDLDYDVEHMCEDGDDPAIPWHTHSEGTGHLPAGGLQSQVWAPGQNGPTFAAGEKLMVRVFYDVPEHPTLQSVDPSIDNMAIFLVFWEEID